MSWDLLEEAKKIISINSITYESNRTLVDYICTLLKPLDVEIHLQKGEHYGKEQLNVIVKKGPKNGDSFLLNTHLDTVSPGDYSLWDKTGGNPFRATIHGDKIYGLGTADVKLDLLCKIKALEKFKGIEFKNPFMLTATYGEESGLVGARKLVEENWLNPPPRYAVVGEPSNLSIVYAHKGFLVLEFTLVDSQAKTRSMEGINYRIDFLGRAAHSSTPQLGINAVQKALEFLKAHKDQCEFIQLQGGELINIIPDKASLKIVAKEKIIPDGEGISIAMEKNKKSFPVFTTDFLHSLEELQALLKKLQSDFKKTPMEEFDPSTSVLNIGVVTTQENKMSLWVGMRLLPITNVDEITGSLQNQIEVIQKKHPTVQITMREDRKNSSMHTELHSKLITEAKNVLRSMSLQETVVTKASSTEASIYRSLGAEAIIWGPGVSYGNVHKPNEFNYLHHLTHAVTFYEKMIETFCVKGLK